MLVITAYYNPEYLFFKLIVDTGKSKEENDSVEDVIEENDQRFDMLKEHYKLPLVWIDLEMTGGNLLLV